MNIILIFLFAVVLVASLSLPILLRAFREKKIAEANLEISMVATKLQKKLLDGEHRNGEICHDVLPKVISYTQFRNRSLPKRFIPSSKDKLIIQKLDKEYEVEESVDKKLIERFTSAMLKAYFAKQPIYVFLFMFVILLYYIGMAILERSWVGWKFVFRRVQEWMMVMGYRDTPIFKSSNPI